MWQTPNQRTSASNLSQKRKKERLERPIRLTRVRAEVRLKTRAPLEANLTSTNTEGEVIEVRVMLNDMSAHGVGIYAQRHLEPGTLVAFRIDEPREMTIEGKVAWSKESGDYKIISKERYSIRVGIQFIFQSPKDEAAFAEFLRDLTKNHLYPDKPPAGK